MPFPVHLVKRWGGELGWKCEVCGRSFFDGWLLEGHHIVPTSQGGKDERSNFKLLCVYHHYLAHLKLRKEKKDHPNSIFIIKARYLRTFGGRTKRWIAVNKPTMKI